jgi:hypothetical protein
MTNTTLAERFPGYEACERMVLDGIEVVVLSKKRDVRRSPIYMGDQEIGVDVSSTFSATLLVPPRNDSAGVGYALLEVSGYSTTSDRYDQDMCTVRCALEDGPAVEIDHTFYYQKYGGRSEKRQGPLKEFAEYFCTKLGYEGLTEQGLAAFVSAVRGRFS